MARCSKLVTTRLASTCPRSFSTLRECWKLSIYRLEQVSYTNLAHSILFHSTLIFIIDPFLLSSLSNFFLSCYCCCYSCYCCCYCRVYSVLSISSYLSAFPFSVVLYFIFLHLIVVFFHNILALACLLPFHSLSFPSLHFPSLPSPSLSFPSLPFPSLPFPSLPFSSLSFSSLPFHKGSEQGMNRRFKEVITKSKDSKVTGSLSAMTYCLGWLEARGRPMVLLDIGKIAQPQLNAFLEVRLAD